MGVKPLCYRSTTGNFRKKPDCSAQLYSNGVNASGYTNGGQRVPVHLHSTPLLSLVKFQGKAQVDLKEVQTAAFGEQHAVAHWPAHYHYWMSNSLSITKKMDQKFVSWG
jgi:hypothetical protein